MITDEEWRLLGDGRLTIAQLLMTAPEPLKIVIAKALLMARNEALDEAARVAEEEDYYADGEKFTRDQVRHNIACSILGLKK